MSDVISSTYEIIEQIGHGGGDNVYLAYHKRLNKKVAIKIDKRKITTSQEALRREVDVLKNLSHSYIPKVYDFVIENDKAYTIVDYVEGESLDKPLKRGQSFSQPQVIKWAKQVLSALAYLHAPIHGEEKKGYMHSDIKPANIMLKPDGDISLIDFNIALALGETHIVGYSPGYASPEHYGIDYSTGATTIATVKEAEDTDVDGEASTVAAERTTSAPTRKNRVIIPDVRSDIYSLGATLYHLLSGIKPANNATDVTSLSSDRFSQQIVDIISKAMDPNPDLRYQSAEEMLSAFNHLRDNDPRTIRLHRAQIVTYSVLSVAFCISVFMSFLGLSRSRTTESWRNDASTAEEKMLSGDVSSATQTILQAFPDKKSIFMPSAPPEALEALAKVVSVYDLENGLKPYCTVALPTETINLTLSGDGKIAAAYSLGCLTLIDVTNGNIIQTLKTANSALCECEFLNGTSLVYAGENGITLYDIEKEQTIWTGAPATAIAVSADKNTVAAIYRDEHFATVYRSVSGEVIGKVDFGERYQYVIENDYLWNLNNKVFSLNDDGSVMAVSFADGSLVLFGIGSDPFRIEVMDSSSGCNNFEGGFYKQYFAFSAGKAEKSVFAVIDINAQKQTIHREPDSFFSVTTSPDGIFYLYKNYFWQIDPASGDKTPLLAAKNQINARAVADAITFAETKDEAVSYEEIEKRINSISTKDEYHFLVIAGDYAVLGNRNTSSLQILRYEEKSDSVFFYFRDDYYYQEARVTSDEAFIMFFSWKHFRIYQHDGTLVCEQDIPNCNSVKNASFKRNSAGDYLEVIYNNGETQWYSAENGALLNTQQGDPDAMLTEDFLTDKFRIERPVHGDPVVYNKKNGRKVRELTGEDYLSTVTQLESGTIVAQFCKTYETDGKSYEEYYGQLWNEDLQVIADLPYLCDVNGNNLFFDYPNGEFHKTSVLSKEELIRIAKKQLVGGN